MIGTMVDLVPDPPVEEVGIRDTEDAYLVSLTAVRTCDFIVTGDKDLLEWEHQEPPCVTPASLSLRGEAFRKVGDMPHNWASAEFIRLTVHLLELDRGDDLHLCEGLPPQWTRPGMVSRLNGIATPFGKLTMELKFAADGKTARLRVEPLSDARCRKIVVHLAGWASDKKESLIEPRSKATE